MMSWLGSSIRRKLTLVVLIATLIPLLFLGGFAYTNSSRLTESKTKQTGIDMLRQMDGNLRFVLQDVENMSMFLIGLNDVQRLVSGGEEDFDARNRVLGITTNLISYKRYISDITIYPARSAEPLSTMNQYSSELSGLLDIRRVDDKLWTRLYRVTNYSGEHRVFSFIRPLRVFGSYQTTGWLSISVDEEALSQYWSKLGQEQGTVILVNSSGEIMSSSEKGWLDRSVESVFPGMPGRIGSDSFGAVTYGDSGLPGERKTVLYYREPLVNWTLLNVIPYEQYRAENRYILQLTAVAVAVAALATGGLTLFVIRRVTKPLAVLTRLLSKLDPNEPVPIFSVESNDEIGRLAGSYNRLGTHIKKLKEQLIADGLRKKEADMRALQAQINPHFLYNTLSSIHWIALMTGEKRITEMVGALSDFLRFSLNKGKDYCTVQQELDHIRSYAQVQSIRYPDEFTVDFVVDPGLGGRMMLKLLLQPLVENAMLHGIKKKGARGTITVYVERQGGRIHFLVHDDGIGMTEDRLHEIRAQLQLSEEEFHRSGSSYGLRNVHERLTLHYGLESGLLIESTQNAGTRISFTIPMLEEHHEDHDCRR